MVLRLGRFLAVRRLLLVLRLGRLLEAIILFAMLRGGCLLGVRCRFRAFSGQAVGRAEHGHGRSEQPDQATPMHTPAVDFDAWQLGLNSRCAADEFPRLHGSPLESMPVGSLPQVTGQSAIVSEM